MNRLARLLRPKSIAVIGGGTWGANVIRASDAMGFEGPIWPVHPSKSDIAGRTAYPSVDDLPGPPDAAFIGVNRAATPDILAALKNKGAGGATCFASGFAEASAELADGAELQALLLDASGDMPFLGPNCYGILNYLDKTAIWPDQHGGIAVETGVAILAQSSNIAINLTMQTRGLPIGYVVTVGNQAQTGMAEIAMEMLRDPRVTALGMHIEGINDLNGLQELSHLSHELNKPVVVLKVGTSDAAQAATMSHTASLAGSAAGASALLERLGFAEARSLTVFVELLKLWHVTGPLPHTRIASASCSGGEACLIADAAHGTSVQFPPLTDEQKAPLRDALGPKVSLANPLDYHTYIWPDTDAMRSTFTALMQADLAMGLVILDFPRGDRCDASEWENVIDAVVQTREQVGKPMAIVSSLGETLPEAICAQLIAKDIVPLCGLDHAIEAISLSSLPAPATLPLLPPWMPREAKLLNEVDAKHALSEHGLRVPKNATFKAAEDAEEACVHLKAPMVVKGVGLAHKSETGAVRLNLSTTEQLLEAASEINAMSYLAEEMIKAPVFELLVGVTLDTAHGYVLTLGAGGTQTELLQDTTHLLLPVTEDDVRHALKNLRHAPILEGYRGKPSCDIGAIWRAVDAVQAYVIAEHGRACEVEINPLICTETDAIAADALIMTGEPE